MKDDELKDLMQDSVLQTSAGFLDRLMKKVAVIDARKFRMHFLLGVLGIIASLLLLARLQVTFHLFGNNWDFSPRIIHVAIAIAFFVGINRLLSLRQQVRKAL